MTTFQDPQPHSRRVARQSERTESAESTVGFTQFPSQEHVETWDTTSRRSAHVPSGPRTGDPAITGRRAAAAPAQTPLAEPLTYTTQSREHVPSYDGPTFRPRASHDELPPTQAIPQSEQPSYRVRDFSPEGRRAAPAPEPTWQSPAPASPTDLDYHTQNGAPVAPVAPVSPPPAPPQQYSQPIEPVHAEGFPEQTLSRREMRAMLQAEQDAALLASGQSAPVAPVQSAPVQQAPVQQAQPAPVQQAPILQEPAQAAPVAPAAETPLDSHEESVFPFALHEPTPAASTEPPVAQQIAEPVLPATPAPQVAEVVEEAAFDPFGFTTPPEPSTNTALTNAIAEFDSLTSSEMAVAPQTVDPVVPAQAQQPAQPPVQVEVTDATGVWTPPVGHWSTQADLDDESQVYENTLNRTIGSGSVTTSALVLPNIPPGSDIRGALTGTGEIMLTGSIDLPRNLSATGATDRFEPGGIDSLFDANDADVVSTDSAPVRAIRAVSTHNTSGHGVTHTQKPKGTRALTALLIAASSMAVVVAGLLIAAFAFNVF